MVAGLAATDGVTRATLAMGAMARGKIMLKFVLAWIGNGVKLMIECRRLTGYKKHSIHSKSVSPFGLV